MDNEELGAELPWYLIYEFLPFRSILSCRATISYMTYSCCSMNPQSCASILSYEMKKRNIHPAWSLATNIPQTANNSVFFSTNKLPLLHHWLTMQNKDGQYISAFDTMLRTLRILHRIPHEILVDFPSKENIYQRSDVDCFAVSRKGSMQCVSSRLSLLFQRLSCPICHSRTFSNGDLSLVIEIVQTSLLDAFVVDASETFNLPIPGVRFHLDERHKSIKRLASTSQRKQLFMTVHCICCHSFGVQSPLNACTDFKQCRFFRKDIVGVHDVHGRNILRNKREALVLARTRCSVFDCNGSVPCKSCSHCVSGVRSSDTWSCERCEARYCEECTEVCNPYPHQQMQYICPCRLSTSTDAIQLKRRKVDEKQRNDILFYGNLSDADNKYLSQFSTARLRSLSPGCGYRDSESESDSVDL